MFIKSGNKSFPEKYMLVMVLGETFHKTYKKGFFRSSKLKKKHKLIETLFRIASLILFSNLENGPAVRNISNRLLV